MGVIRQTIFFSLSLFGSGAASVAFDAPTWRCLLDRHERRSDLCNFPFSRAKQETASIGELDRRRSPKSA
jgi:hypothetical protein